jgi:hypothetical protein
MRRSVRPKSALPRGSSSTFASACQSERASSPRTASSGSKARQARVSRQPQEHGRRRLALARGCSETAVSSPERGASAPGPPDLPTGPVLEDLPELPHSVDQRLDHLAQDRPRAAAVTPRGAGAGTWCCARQSPLQPRSPRPAPWSATLAWRPSSSTILPKSAVVPVTLLRALSDAGRQC